MRAEDVRSQSAPVVRGIWPSETGLRGFGSGRFNAAPPDVPVERPLTGTAHVGERPIAEAGGSYLNARKPTCNYR